MNYILIIILFIFLGNCENNKQNKNYTDEYLCNILLEKSYSNLQDTSVDYLENFLLCKVITEDKENNNPLIRLIPRDAKK
ncbi:MAG: hypothetical protein MH321_03160 [Leptospiraceae bacterium]|nr:hypothetical protein [Leptospiraceae bacterium]